MNFLVSGRIMHDDHGDRLTLPLRWIEFDSGGTHGGYRDRAGGRLGSQVMGNPWRRAKQGIAPVQIGGDPDSG